MELEKNDGEWGHLGPETQLLHVTCQMGIPASNI